MPNLGEPGRRFTADPLCWRIGGNELWMIAFDGAELAHQVVVVGVRDRWIIQPVVGMVRFANPYAQGLESREEGTVIAMLCMLCMLVVGFGHAPAPPFQDTSPAGDQQVTSSDHAD